MRRWFSRLIRTLVLLVLMVTLLLILFRIRYSNVIHDLAQTQIRNTTSDLINEAIARQIASGEIQYDRIVYFEKDLNGRITALKTNIGEVNRLKTATLERINGEILALDTSDVGIPVGSLLLPEFFSGKGLLIPIRILAVRNSDATFQSDFTEAGINQTLHRLIMTVQVDIAVLVWGDTAQFTVESSVVVAETVIVGEVPTTYLQTGGNHGSEKENG